MAELEMATGGSVAGPVQDLARWGILRLLPRWLAEQAGPRGRVGRWPDVAALPVPVPREEPLVAGPAQTTAPLAAAIALRHTLDAWRAAERDLASLATGSPDRALVQADVDAHRATHRRLFLEISLPGRAGAVDAERG